MLVSTQSTFHRSTYLQACPPCFLLNVFLIEYLGSGTKCGLNSEVSKGKPRRFLGESILRDDGSHGRDMARSRLHKNDRQACRRSGSEGGTWAGNNPWKSRRRVSSSR
ncbi:hypothetical protein GUITHDRAFT_155265 [Guillardia theta CCMP2712]|uniref:Uncharacterized protein n=1 Tax=Guillardia theta (strain CCMP2712) TaxID=905079 RepID=L1IKD4_GUITC|nr:hypothetical protein GUITHDRAFT_155265 [Guillardia theta CCMP2712]EKX36374.1 hypothetical protein GUITHDRAFT_155265 [Guillardia theta CCMP2712]|mmetsp:Transcript_19436/g.64382  ORF Transcript_19436/g.64382 Transcript_19436/m.64382 type:complete len:108 (+) Transcript_19436:1248-1571(+)|eukprot:XP_005823354.1 hypothetical protein GUITHDRAFT_155265 [Guillardia theta CCMP2712]